MLNDDLILCNEHLRRKAKERATFTTVASNWNELFFAAFSIHHTKHLISTYYRLYKNTRGPSYSDLVDLEKVVPKVRESFSSFPASIRIARSTFERCPSTFHPKR